jgi:hypothetical protein
MAHRVELTVVDRRPNEVPEISFSSVELLRAISTVQGVDIVCPCAATCYDECAMIRYLEEAFRTEAEEQL